MGGGGGGGVRRRAPAEHGVRHDGDRRCRERRIWRVSAWVEQADRQEASALAEPRDKAPPGRQPASERSRTHTHAHTCTPAHTRVSFMVLPIRCNLFTETNSGLREGDKSCGEPPAGLEGRVQAHQMDQNFHYLGRSKLNCITGGPQWRVIRRGIDCVHKSFSQQFLAGVFSGSCFFGFLGFF